jgi:hypothetical protein
MTTPAHPFEVHPRRDGQPEADLLAFTLIHRALRCAPRTLARALRSESTRPGDDRHRAAVRFGRAVLAEIHSHHRREDDVLWPVIAASAGAAVDLRPLTDDHETLAPLLALVDRALDDHERVADDATSARLADALTTLADLLDAHIADEEAAVFPVIRTYVSAEDFAQCERRFRKGTSIRHMAFLLPWIMAHATPPERATALEHAGRPLRLLLRATSGRYERMMSHLR